MRFFIILIIGAVLGALGFWFLMKKAGEHPTAQQRYEEAVVATRNNVEAATRTASEALRAKLETLDLHTAEIRAELEHSGEIVRYKAHDIGAQAVNAVTDTRAVAEIKAKYLADSRLSAWKISVSCSQGHVTLSGTVSSPEEVGRAVALALEADGVRDVTSTIQVKPTK